MQCERFGRDEEAARGHADQAGKQTCKGTRRGGGKGNADKSDGWHCKHCEFYNFGYRPVCFKCKEVKDPKAEGPGVPVPKAKAVASLEEILRSILLWPRISRPYKRSCKLRFK
eukprot:3679514-Amphidinium_carterae.1